jgi:hypothetical protein
MWELEEAWQPPFGKLVQGIGVASRLRKYGDFMVVKLARDLWKNEIIDSLVMIC